MSYCLLYETGRYRELSIFPPFWIREFHRSFLAFMNTRRYNVPKIRGANILLLLVNNLTYISNRTAEKIIWTYGRKHEDTFKAFTEPFFVLRCAGSHG